MFANGDVHTNNIESFWETLKRGFYAFSIDNYALRESFFIFIYANGIYDYFMMLGHNEAYYSAKNYGETVLAYFTDYPMLPLLFWTINVFSSPIAPILLLFRSRWAVQVSLISSVSILCLDFLTFAFRDRWDVLGPWISLFDIAILLMTFGLFFYCRAMAKRSVLR